MNVFANTQREFIARPDQFKDQIVYKWPDENIRKLSQLTVEQDEQAVFFRNGQIVGAINPGRATLDSAEIPFLGGLIDQVTGGNLFKSELYFVSTREFPDLPFGGMIDNVVDPETQLAVGLRVYGDYSLKVVQPQALILNLVGTGNARSNQQITDWMREMLLKAFRSDVVGHISAQGWPILGIAAHNADIEQETMTQALTFTAPYGIQIVRMGNFTISIKPEDEDNLKKFRTQVQYSKLAGGFQQAAAAEALEGIGEGAAKGGGSANPAVIGIGMGLGQAALAGGVATSGPPAAPLIQVRCLRCGSLNAEAAKFCSNCGAALAPPEAAPNPSA